MSDNMAKSFATMKLIYWKPIITGSGVKFETPVEFKGFYIGNAQLGDSGISDMIHADGGVRDNLVLAYLCELEVEGYVCWDKTLAELTAADLLDMPPGEIEGTHKIKAVTVYVMPGTKVATLKSKAFFASVQ